MKKILINGLLLNNKLSGVQYYVKNLLDEIETSSYLNFEYDALLSYNYQKKVEYKNVKIEYPIINTSNRINRVLFEHFLLSKCYSKRFDLLHAPGYILPSSWQKASVLTVHDLIALDFPHLCQNGTAFYFKALLPYSIKKATKIIAVSNTVKIDILRRFDIEEDKVHVVYHGVNKQFKKIHPNDQITQRVKDKYNLPDKYILFVGNIEPKKNLVNLISAFYKLRINSEIEHQLVIVGQKGWKCKSVFKKILELGMEKELIFTDYVPEEDLPAVYSMADLFVFPSLYEGFGIPPLEAMACEVPVMVSNRGALPEITGGKCMQVDPYNIEEMTGGMYKLLTDNNVRSRCIQDSKEWVKQFFWEKTAKETLQVYKEAINA